MSQDSSDSNEGQFVIVDFDDEIVSQPPRQDDSCNGVIENSSSETSPCTPCASHEPEEGTGNSTEMILSREPPSPVLDSDVERLSYQELQNLTLRLNYPSNLEGSVMRQLLLAHMDRDRARVKSILNAEHPRGEVRLETRQGLVMNRDNLSLPQVHTTSTPHPTGALGGDDRVVTASTLNHRPPPPPYPVGSQVVHTPSSTTKSGTTHRPDTPSRKGSSQTRHPPILPLPHKSTPYSIGATGGDGRLVTISTLSHRPPPPLYPLRSQTVQTSSTTTHRPSTPSSKEGSQTYYRRILPLPRKQQSGHQLSTSAQMVDPFKQQPRGTHQPQSVQQRTNQAQAGYNSRSATPALGQSPPKKEIIDLGLYKNQQISAQSADSQQHSRVVSQKPADGVHPGHMTLHDTPQHGAHVPSQELVIDSSGCVARSSAPQPVSQSPPPLYSPSGRVVHHGAPQQQSHVPSQQLVFNSPGRVACSSAPHTVSQSPPPLYSPSGRMVHHGAPQGQGTSGSAAAKEPQGSVPICSPSGHVLHFGAPLRHDSSSKAAVNGPPGTVTIRSSDGRVAHFETPQRLGTHFGRVATPQAYKPPQDSPPGPPQTYRTPHSDSLSAHVPRCLIQQQSPRVPRFTPYPPPGYVVRDLAAERRSQGTLTQVSQQKPCTITSNQSQAPISMRTSSDKLWRPFDVVKMRENYNRTISQRIPPSTVVESHVEVVSSCEPVDQTPTHHVNPGLAAGLSSTDSISSPGLAAGLTTRPSGVPPLFPAIFTGPTKPSAADTVVHRAEAVTRPHQSARRNDKSHAYCKFALHGCQRYFMLRALRTDHEARCFYHLVACVFPCGWKGPVISFSEHVQKDHASVIVDKGPSVLYQVSLAVLREHSMVHLLQVTEDRHFLIKMRRAKNLVNVSCLWLPTLNNPEVDGRPVIVTLRSFDHKRNLVDSKSAVQVFPCGFQAAAATQHRGPVLSMRLPPAYTDAQVMFGVEIRLGPPFPTHQARDHPTPRVGSPGAILQPPSTPGVPVAPAPNSDPLDRHPTSLGSPGAILQPPSTPGLPVAPAPNSDPLDRHPTSLGQAVEPPPAPTPLTNSEVSQTEPECDPT